MAQIERDLEGSMRIENEVQALKQRKCDSDGALHELHSKLNAFPTQFLLDLSRMANWDRRRVFGRVFELFEVTEPAYLKALEVGAGPKLNNVVVDDEDTGAYMLKNNVLNQMAYFIPNSKVTAFQPSEEVLRVADRIAREHEGYAKHATQLIRFQP